MLSHFSPNTSLRRRPYSAVTVDDGVEAFVLDGGQQVSHLRFGVERAGKLRRVRHDDQISWVCLDQTVPLRQFERLIEHVLVLAQANRG